MSVAARWTEAELQPLLLKFLSQRPELGSAIVATDALDLNGGRGGIGGGISSDEAVITSLMVGLSGCDEHLSPSFL